MTKNYEYIEQLLDSYFECQTTLEEEQILRAFFAQENVPMELLPYRKLFAEQAFEKNAESLGNDFDQRILSQIGELEAEEPKHVTARVVSIHKRLRPLYKAVACVAIILALGQAAQMPYYQSDAEQQQNMARSLEQLQQIQKDNLRACSPEDQPDRKGAVAKSDSVKTLQSLESVKN